MHGVKKLMRVLVTGLGGSYKYNKSRRTPMQGKIEKMFRQHGQINIMLHAANVSTVEELAPHPRTHKMSVQISCDSDVSSSTSQ